MQVIDETQLGEASSENDNAIAISEPDNFVYIYQLGSRYSMRDLTAKSDEELLYLVKEGNRAAFSVLYDRYWKVLIMKSLHRLKSQDDAEEVVQALFVNLWKRRERIALKYSFRTYIFAALRYELLHHIAKNMQRAAFLQLDELENTAVPLDFADAERLELKELQLEIDGLVDSLPAKCKLIFKMSREEGMSAREIAQNLDISPRTVETQIGKALKTLRSVLKKLPILYFL